MWITSTPDVLRTENVKEAASPVTGSSAPIWVIEDRLAISASAATVFALAIRRAALSRLVESASPRS